MNTLVVVLLVAVLVANVVLAPRRFERWLAVRRGNPAALTRFYVRLIAGTWVLSLAVPMTLLVTPGLAPAELGWRWPHNALLGYGLAAYTAVLIVLGARGRRRRLAGGRYALPETIAALLPTTTTQRWLAVGLSVTAGVVEEAIFRGLLIWAGTELVGLHVYVAAALSLALFASGHTYQGRAGVIGAASLGFVFTGIYVITGSLLLPIILHIGQDIGAFLLTPRRTSINIFQRI